MKRLRKKIETKREEMVSSLSEASRLLLGNTKKDDKLKEECFEFLKGYLDIRDSAIDFDALDNLPEIIQRLSHLHCCMNVVLRSLYMGNLMTSLPEEDVSKFTKQLFKDIKREVS